MPEPATVERLRWLCDQLPRWLPPPLGDPNAPPPGGDGTEIPWPLFREAAFTHCVAPLLAEGLAGIPEVDPVLTAWLEHQRVQNRLRVELLQSELREILRHTADLPLIPFKGPVLAERYYPDPTLRPMNDLDLLLPQEHFPRCIEILGTLGYRHRHGGWKHDLLQRPGNDAVVETTFEHRDNPRSIELHPRCRERLDDAVFDLTDRFYASAQRQPVLGETALLPAPAELWLYLLLHATHHILMGNFRLMHLVDLAWITPEVEDPVAVLETLDPRATYGPLVLLARTFPQCFGEGVAAACQGAAKKHLAPSYAQWAEGLDLYTVSYLNPAPWRVD